jgi:hypothetical protein
VGVVALKKLFSWWDLGPLSFPSFLVFATTT